MLTALADRGVAIPAAAIVSGMRDARWPGRFERAPREPRLVWDGAHNADGMRALAAAWRAAGFAAPAAVVLALSRDKDAGAVLAVLAELAPHATFVATRSRDARALDPLALAKLAEAAGLNARTAPAVEAACRAALALAPSGDSVLLTGSLFALGEAMESFGGAPGEQL